MHAHLIDDYLGPPSLQAHMAARLVQFFLHGRCCILPIHYTGMPHFPQNLPISMEGYGSPSYEHVYSSNKTVRQTEYKYIHDSLKISDPPSQMACRLSQPFFSEYTFVVSGKTTELHSKNRLLVLQIHAAS